MTVWVELNGEERERLEQTFKHTADRPLREHCQAVLMAARGRRRRQIAEDPRTWGASDPGAPLAAGVSSSRAGRLGDPLGPEPQGKRMKNRPTTGFVALYQ